MGNFHERAVVFVANMFKHAERYDMVKFFVYVAVILKSSRDRESFI